MENGLQTTTAQDNCVMTLKQIVDFINQKRGVSKGDKGFKRHSQAMVTIEKLALEAPSFGGAKKLTLKYNGQNFETYHLTAKQSIACGAKLDNGLLMEVIDKVEELENKQRVITPSIKQQKIELIRQIVNQNNDIVNQNKQLADIIVGIEDEESVTKITTEETDLINTRKVRASYTKQTKHQYYRLKVTPLNQLSKLIASPTTGKVVFEYYNKNTSIICLKANDFKAQKIPTPAWLKNKGNYGKFSAKVVYRKKGKRGFLDKIIKG